MQLDALKRGETVILSITDDRLPRKRRVDHPTLFITPFDSHGEGSYLADVLLFSFPGYGCELIPLDELTPDKLYRMGLTFRAAKLLTNAIKQLFEIKELKDETIIS